MAANIELVALCEESSCGFKSMKSYRYLLTDKRHERSTSVNWLSFNSGFVLKLPPLTHVLTTLSNGSSRSLQNCQYYCFNSRLRHLSLTDTGPRPSPGSRKQYGRSSRRGKQWTGYQCSPVE